MADHLLAVLGQGLTDPTTPLLRADDLAVLRGEGVFETVHIVAGHPVQLDRHLARLAVSATRVDIALPAAHAWRELVTTVLTEWAEPEGVLRLVCSKGPAGESPVGFALLAPVPSEHARQRRDGISAVTLTLGVPADLRPDAPWLLGGVKSTSYAVNMASQRAAVALGADDAVWVSCDGEVLEAPTSTVVWVSGSTLVTPPPQEVGVLDGTTGAAVRELAPRVGLRVEVRRGAVAELRGADEAALVSSVRGVAPLIRLDDAPIGSGTVGPRVAALQAAHAAWIRTG